jgi:Flp pilus assembly protein TadB
MFLVMLGLYPDYARELLEHPWMIVAMGFSMAVGAAWIHRIVNFDI